MNPYESPSLKPEKPHSVIGLLLRIFAVILWLAAPLPVIGFLSILNRSENIERRADNPVLFYGLALIAFGLPAIGIALFGAAAWWQKWWLALLGLLGFAPIISFVAWHLAR